MTMLKKGPSTDLSEMPEFYEEFAEEFRQELLHDLQLIKQGKVKEAVLFQAVAFNWSPKRLMDVARQRGRNFRFLAALGDTLLQIEGIGIRHLTTHIVGDNVSIAGAEQSIKTILYLRELMAQHEDDPLIVEMLEKRMIAARDVVEEVAQNYWNEIHRIWG